jgi:hypothetical protein
MSYLSTSGEAVESGTTSVSGTATSGSVELGSQIVLPTRWGRHHIDALQHPIYWAREAREF